MEPADSSSPPEQNPVSSRNGDSETWSEGLNMDKDFEERLTNRIHESVSSIDEFSRQWEEYGKEMELKEISVKKLIQEQEERLRLVEERERKVDLMEASVTERLSELEERLVLQTQNEQVFKRNEELMGEVEAKTEELVLLSCEFDLKKTAEIERMRKEAEVIEISRKQLEVRESEISLLNETINEKSAAIEIEAKTKFLEMKEKELEEKEKELELKQRGFEEEADTQETRKRSRREFESSRKEPASSTSSPVRISETHEGDAEEVVSLADSDDEEPEQLHCVDSEFNDFTNKKSSFEVGQVWALYDEVDCMPRCYGRIKRVNKSRRFKVIWIVPKDDDSVPVSCGRFTWGITETVGHLTFSHEIHPIIYGRNFIS